MGCGTSKKCSDPHIPEPPPTIPDPPNITKQLDTLYRYLIYARSQAELPYLHKGTASLHQIQNECFLLTCEPNAYSAQSAHTSRIIFKHQQQQRVQIQTLEFNNRDQWPGEDKEHNLTVIRLDYLEEHRKSLYTLSHCNDAKADDKITIIGFSDTNGFAGNGQLISFDQRIDKLIRDQTTTYIYYKNAKKLGLSGAPILWFNKDVAKWYTIGVHFEGQEENYGIGFTTQDIDWIHNTIQSPNGLCQLPLIPKFQNKFKQQIDTIKQNYHIDGEELKALLSYLKNETSDLPLNINSIQKYQGLSFVVTRYTVGQIHRGKHSICDAARLRFIGDLTYLSQLNLIIRYSHMMKS